MVKQKKVLQLAFQTCMFLLLKDTNCSFIYLQSEVFSVSRQTPALPRVRLASPHPPAPRRSSPKRGAAAGAAGSARLPPGPAERRRRAAARCLLPAPARWRLWFWQELAAPGVGDFKDWFLFFCILYMGERMRGLREASRIGKTETHLCRRVFVRAVRLERCALYFEILFSPGLWSTY